MYYLFFFFNDTATTEIYTLSLHDALPISIPEEEFVGDGARQFAGEAERSRRRLDPALDRRFGWRMIEGRVNFQDRKSTRLNSSHLVISYAVFCLKKKKNKIKRQ